MSSLALKHAGVTSLVRSVLNVLLELVVSFALALASYGSGVTPGNGVVDVLETPLADIDHTNHQIVTPKDASIEGEPRSSFSSA